MRRLDRLDQIDALPQLYFAAGRDLPDPLPGRLVIGAKQVNPSLNAPVRTYDVGAIFLHLLGPTIEALGKPQNADAVCPENYGKQVPFALLAPKRKSLARSNKTRMGCSASKTLLGILIAWPRK